MNNNRNNTTVKEYIARINKVILYVTENLGEEFNLQKLSDIACFSQYHFHRIFTSIVRETPNDFIRRLRLEKAAIMLLNNLNTPVFDIAVTCGFNSHSSFTRAFKDRFDLNPTEWRERKAMNIDFENSKIRQIESKNGEESDYEEQYLTFVIDDFSNNNRSLIMNVEIKEMPSLRLAYVANLEGYEQSKISQAWGSLCRWAGPRGLINPTAKFIGISFDDPDITEKDKCRYYACLTVPEHIQAEKEIGILETKAGKYAIARFEINPDEFSKIYEEIYGRWLPVNGWQPEDFPSYEIYHNTPDRHPEGKFVLDLCVPVKPM